MDIFNNFYNKISEMVQKKKKKKEENGLTLLPSRRSSTVSLDLPKSNKRLKLI
jgi:hypothetical protein